MMDATKTMSINRFHSADLICGSLVFSFCHLHLRKMVGKNCIKSE